MGSQALATTPRSPLAAMAYRLSIDAAELESVLQKTVMPSDRQVTPEQFVSFLAVANAYGVAVCPTITLAEVNSLAREWITDENRVIWANAPKKDGVTAPTADQILAVIDRASKATLTPWVETLADAPLLANLPPAGRVTSTRTIDAVGVTEWKLSNGVRVLVKPGDEVTARQGLLVVEAMKMENELAAPRAGRVAEVLVTEGQSVEGGRLLVRLD